MSDTVQAYQLQQLLAFVRELAQEEPNHDYPCGNVGDHLSVTWQYRAEDLLDELGLNGD
jgi:hypothetical protein